MTQNVFQRQLGVMWVTYLDQFFENWDDLNTPTPEICGLGYTPAESADQFVKALDRAIKNGVITITKGQ